MYLGGSPGRRGSLPCELGDWLLVECGMVVAMDVLSMRREALAGSEALAISRCTFTSLFPGV